MASILKDHDNMALFFEPNNQFLLEETQEYFKLQQSKELIKGLLKQKGKYKSEAHNQYNLASFHYNYCTCNAYHW
jgi:hypothetical protein